MNKKTNEFLNIPADIGYVLGTVIAWYTVFFIYGQFTLMYEMGSITDIARRMLVFAVFAIAAVIYYFVTVFYLKKRKSKNLAFWFGCLHGFLMLITAQMMIFGDNGSFLWIFLLVTYYPIIAMIIIIVYILMYVYKYITKERPVDRLR